MEGEIEQGEVASSQPKDVLDCRSVDDESSLVRNIIKLLIVSRLFNLFNFLSQFPVNTEASTKKKKDEISNTPAVFRANDRIHTDLTKVNNQHFSSYCIQILIDLMLSKGQEKGSRSHWTSLQGLQTG